MNFYVVVDGELEKRTMCDNPDCPDYTTREGINPQVWGIGLDYCSRDCEDQVENKSRHKQGSGMKA